MDAPRVSRHNLPGSQIFHLSFNVNLQFSARLLSLVAVTLTYIRRLIKAF